jgi:hypothetical protein
VDQSFTLLEGIIFGKNLDRTQTKDIFSKHRDLLALGE